MHEPGKHVVVFRKGDEEEAAERERRGRNKSPFEAWFDLNRTHVRSRVYTFDQV